MVIDEVFDVVKVVAKEVVTEVNIVVVKDV